MPLVSKKITHSKATFLSWLCCLPCNAVAALVCIVTCQCGKAKRCACSPCVDSELVRKAGSIASNTLFYLPDFEDSQSNLLALKTEQWNPAALFGIDAMVDPLRVHLRNQIAESVLDVLNAYNFGPIPSESLTDDELTSIGQQLRNAIFAQLPTKEDFERALYDNSLDSRNINRLNEFLAKIISTIIDGDFIYTQLNRIGDAVELKRTGFVLVAAQAQVGLFKGKSAGLDVDQANNIAQPLRQSPVYSPLANG